MAGLGLLGAAVTLLTFMFHPDEEVVISVEQITQFDRSHPVEVSL
jgi:cytochrome o ubiquinol oxidase subunit 1